MAQPNLSEWVTCIKATGTQMYGIQVPVWYLRTQAGGCSCSAPLATPLPPFASGIPSPPASCSAPWAAPSFRCCEATSGEPPTAGCLGHLGQSWHWEPKVYSLCYAFIVLKWQHSITLPDYIALMTRSGGIVCFSFSHFFNHRFCSSTFPHQFVVVVVKKNPHENSYMS